MANSEHVKILEQGVAVWNSWRDNNRDIRPNLDNTNLSGANLRHADLSEAFLDNANLSGADLSEADLSGAELSEADLSEANLSGANLAAFLPGADLSKANLLGAYLPSTLSGANLSAANLRNADLSPAHLDNANLSGANLCDAKLSEAGLSEANLSAADLSGAALIGAGLHGADLSGANLFSADLRFTDLRRSNLIKADLSEAELRGARLTESNLSRANLIRADLSEADLSGVNMRGAMLAATNLSRANLSEADLRGAILAETILGDLDLSQTQHLDACVHEEPSIIDHRTVQKSGNLPLSFLRGVGMPDELIEYLPSLLGSVIEFYSCFISYSTNDQDFADHIHADLQNKGVRCWFAPHDIQGGKKLREQIDHAIRVYDRLLLILSKSSMGSEWVKTEIADARQKEMTHGRRVLFPIGLASFNAIKTWKCFDADAGKDSAREIREYFIPDFSNWKDHDSYQAAFDRLLRDLKKAPGDDEPTDG